MARAPLNADSDFSKSVFENVGFDDKTGRDVGDNEADNEADGEGTDDLGSDSDQIESGPEDELDARAPEADDQIDEPETDETQGDDFGFGQDDGSSRRLTDQQRDQIRQRRGQMTPENRGVTQAYGDLQLLSNGNVILKGTKIDAAGNVRGKDGKVIARAGRERSFYNAANKAAFVAADIQNRGRATREDVESRLEQAIELGMRSAEQVQILTQAGNEFTKLGLSATENLEALQLFVEGKRNPTELLKKLLTRAAVNGIDGTTLGLQPGSVEPNALLTLIKEEIAKSTAPITAQTTETQRQAQERQQAEEIFARTEQRVTAWFRSNPDMERHAPIIDQILSNPRTKHLSLDAIAGKIRYEVLRRSQQTNQTRRRKAVPNGRTNFGGRGSGGDEGSREIAPMDPRVSYDDIIKMSLRDGGYRAS